MKNENDKKLDVFLKQILQETALEQPSVHFTEGVLDKIEQQQVEVQHVLYQPIISKKIWVLIVMIIGLTLYLSINGINSEIFALQYSFLNKGSELKLHSLLPNFTSSNIVIYATMAVGFFVLIQVYWLKKNWSDKQVVF
jgi:hypothetical protein